MRFLVAFAFAAGCVSAQQKTAAAPVHETVFVTGTATPAPLEEADRDVNVLPLPTKERALFGSWFDLLSLDPSLTLQQRAPGGFIADLSIRGATYGQTLVLVDGMRVNDAQTSHFNLDLPIPLELISSIEVLKGSGSTLYGSDAIGGVVNVRTGVPLTPDVRLFTGIGNFGTNQEHGRAAFRLGGVTEQLVFARDFSTGFAPDRDYRNLTLSSSTSYRSSSLLFSYADRPYGADQFYGTYPSWERTKSWFLSAHQNLGTRTEASFAYRRHTDLFVLFRYQPERYTNRHLDESYQGNVRRHENLPANAVLSYGAEGLADSIDSTNLGTRQRKRGSAYAIYQIRTARRFSLSAGLREEVYGSGKAVTSPSLSGAAWINTRIKIRAAASRAFRIPSYTDLYYTDPMNRGDANLKPESATSYEAGADAYFSSSLRASLTVFQRRDTNVIDYVRPSPKDIWQATNFDKLHFTGVEASVAYRGLTASFAGLHGSSASGTVLLSKYTFNYPSQDAVLSWRGSLGKSVLARTRVGVVKQINRDAYAVWDASATYSRGHVRPFLQLTNITSTVYQEIPGIALPKRGVLGGVELVFYGAAQ